MLAYILAIAVGLGSVALYMAAFFFPEVHRKGDFVWSGVGFFYALTLWACAGRITGAVLLGQGASVALIGWWGWQTLTLRRAVAPAGLKTPVPPKVQQQLAEVFPAEPIQSPQELKSQELKSQELGAVAFEALQAPIVSEPINPGVEGVVEGIQAINQKETPTFSAPEDIAVTDTELEAVVEPRDFGSEAIPPLEAPTLGFQPGEMPISETLEISQDQDSSPTVEFVEEPFKVLPSRAEPQFTSAQSAPATQPKGLSKLLSSMTGLFQRKKGQPQSAAVPLATAPEQLEQAVDSFGQKVQGVAEIVKEKVQDAIADSKEALADLESTDFGQKVQGVAETVKEKVQDVIADSKEALADLESTEFGQKVQNKVQGVAETVKEKVQDVIADSKEVLADLESTEFGQKVQGMAETVKEKVQDAIADSKEALGETVQALQASSDVNSSEFRSENPGPEGADVILEIIQLNTDPSIEPETLTVDQTETGSVTERSEAERSDFSEAQSAEAQPQVALEAPSLDDYSTETAEKTALKRPNPPTPKPKKAPQKPIEKPELDSE
ncbi:MAG: Ycf66 family protein [Microcoleaceae cyanobacterium]